MTGRPANERQQQFAELAIQGVLLVAPAGCGKTEALAHRAAAVIRRGDVQLPHRVLALTYSNKAKNNLAGRIRALLGPTWRTAVTITNFHGLATRLIQSHGAVIGVDPAVVLPDKPWRRKKLRELGAEYDDEFEAALHDAKADDADDDLVMERLITSGNVKALTYEQALRAAGRIDYDDQIRHASRLLADPAVARLYQAHFSLVMVDEVQDLSMRQLAMVQAIGTGTATYAGDPAQGIYSFAGAQPTEVFASIEASGVTILELDESYRSSPAVLNAVNTVAAVMGSVTLKCGAPDKWPNEGHVLACVRANTEHEAQALADFFATHDLNQTSIGVVTRRSARLNDLRAALKVCDVGFTDWGAPTHVARVVDLLKRFLLEAVGADDKSRLAHLEELCRGAVDSADAETLDEIALACEELNELLDEGSTLAGAVDSCRSDADPDEPVPPGVHLLTGHLGKGQEFDWVVVTGLEDGHVPDFRNVAGPELDEELRVLHVMLSRARYGLVITRADQTWTKYGWRDASPSRWFDVLASATTGGI